MELSLAANGSDVISAYPKYTLGTVKREKNVFCPISDAKMKRYGIDKISSEPYMQPGSREGCTITITNFRPTCRHGPDYSTAPTLGSH